MRTRHTWPSTWPICLGPVHIDLPLVDSDGFKIYAFDSMGRTRWNMAAAEALCQKLAAYDFDIMLTAESKAIALTEELSRLRGQADYVVLRKSRKLYMIDPVVLDVQSITTAARQQFFLGRAQQELLRGKRVCVVDDVISTGGTMGALFELARRLEFEVTVNACVLTEEKRWTDFDGVPVVSLGHIPLPAYSAGPREVLPV